MLGTTVGVPFSFHWIGASMPVSSVSIASSAQVATDAGSVPAGSVNVAAEPPVDVEMSTVPSPLMVVVKFAPAIPRRKP